MPSRKNKPLVEMNPEELRQTFAELGLSGTFGMLEDARNGVGQEMVLAVCLLTRPDGSKAIVMVDNEYGDGCGIECIETLIDDDIGRFPGMLREGESVEQLLYKVTSFEVIKKHPDAKRYEAERKAEGK